MSNFKTELPTAERLKQRAKKIKKEHQISHNDALDLISKEYGFNNWKEIQIELHACKQAKIPTPLPTTTFVEYDDVVMTDNDFDILDQERSDELSLQVKNLVINNKKQLTKIGAEFSVFEPTITGLNKSILDATDTVRNHFELENFHYYWEQGQGQENKIKTKAYLLCDDEKLATTVSLYRPNTKKGDPRMWFSKLPNFAAAGDQVAIIILNNTPFLINLSSTQIEYSLTKDSSCIKDFFDTYTLQRNNIPNELLIKLKELAKKPFPSLRSGDTGIGFTLEEMLGIPANSSKKPDYKGIELKAGRSKKTRTTLFAQVADWSISPCKKSAEILNKYGYERGDDFKLYCSLSTQRENSQGLSFIYDQTADQLQEWHNKSELVAIWPGHVLRNRLREKHAETFWIEAKSEMINGVEHFQLISVTHTKSPILSQLIPLFQVGVVTMDHLIKKNVKGQVSEKGPLFKMNKKDLGLLFPEPITHSLTKI
ncbi:MvaI/BcnI family restriction endonuclease [Aliivibrio wodanis]|uniref:MvaI/BcnI family restriction endonuclease n=1 Tax=Aliivibrio wodanis TaxID=80852 RepID=UPI00406CE640